MFKGCLSFIFTAALKQRVIVGPRGFLSTEIIKIHLTVVKQV